MSLPLPTPAVLRRYFDEVAGRVLPAFVLRWEPDLPESRDRLWELPEGVCLVGPPPDRFGIKVERVAPDAYAVRVLWGRTRLAWEALTRVQLLTSALLPLTRALGDDLRTVLDQPVRAERMQPEKVA